ncbi:MAG: galactokinase [Actinobacteria bacterium]|nr:galactokinase [Actinomycetota bacterium]
MASTQTAAEGFKSRFGGVPEGVWSAPGRVNLIGEHTDYNEGFVLPFAIDRRTFAAVSLRADSIARVASSFTEQVIEISVADVSNQTVSGWSAYPLGVAWALIQAGSNAQGFDLFVDSNVPVGSGLSSSAALESSVAIALNELWGAGLHKSQLAKIGQRAENEIVGAPTGIMDQTASLFGVTDHAVFLDCRTLHSEAIALGLKQNSLEIVVMDTNVSHRLVDGGYASRRAACESAARDLGVTSLRDVSVEDLEDAKLKLDPLVFKRLRHVVTENARVLETVKLLKKGGPLAIGGLLLASHESMRDDFEISVDELDCAVEVAIRSGAIGSRMTGGGFGGAAIALIDSSKIPELTDAVAKEFDTRGFIAPTVFSVSADAGARREI